MSEMQKKLNEQITELLEARMAAKVVIHRDYLVTEIVRMRVLPPGPDREFWDWAAHQAVAQLVRKKVSSYRVSARERTPEQLAFPGWKHLQKFYAIGTEEEPQLVPVELLSAEQRREKIAELRRMGDSCHEHADELQRYGEMTVAA
jgi:hypothetical protein